MEYAFKKKKDAVKLRDSFMAWYRPQCDDEFYIPMIRREVRPDKRFVLEIPQPIAVKFAIWEALQ